MDSSDHTDPRKGLVHEVLLMGIKWTLPLARQSSGPPPPPWGASQPRGEGRTRWCWRGSSRWAACQHPPPCYSQHRSRCQSRGRRWWGHRRQPATTARSDLAASSQPTNGLLTFHDFYIFYVSTSISINISKSQYRYSNVSPVLWVRQDLPSYGWKTPFLKIVISTIVRSQLDMDWT